jgi:hypothetical protein
MYRAQVQLSCGLAQIVMRRTSVILWPVIVTHYYYIFILNLENII